MPTSALSTSVADPTGFVPLNVSTVIGLSLFVSLLGVATSGPAVARNGRVRAETMRYVSCMFAVERITD